MNFQHLRHFIAVAEELHFGRAAERLGMAQPPLSQSIRRLEDSLGCPLFTRSRRRVELAPAGEVLLEHAREILGQIEYAQKAVLRANAAGVSALTIGFTPNALCAVVPATIRELRRLAPGVQIKLQECMSSEQVSRLLSGDLDLSFFHPKEPHIRGLEMRVVSRSTPVAAIPEAWPLAKKELLRLADFEALPLLLYPEAHRPETRALLMAGFRRAGVTPTVTQEASYDATRLKLVAAEMGVSLVSAINAIPGYPGVVFRPIEDLPDGIYSEMSLAWRRGAPAPVRRLFLSVYEAVRQLHPVTSDDPQLAAA